MERLAKDRSTINDRVEDSAAVSEHRGPYQNRAIRPESPSRGLETVPGHAEQEQLGRATKDQLASVSWGEYWHPEAE